MQSYSSRTMLERNLIAVSLSTNPVDNYVDKMGGVMPNARLYYCNVKMFIF